jgi:hypothetical protein
MAQNKAKVSDKILSKCADRLQSFCLRYEFNGNIRKESKAIIYFLRGPEFKQKGGIRGK